MGAIVEGEWDFSKDEILKTLQNVVYNGSQDLGTIKQSIYATFCNNMRSFEYYVGNRPEKLVLLVINLQKQWHWMLPRKRILFETDEFLC